MTERKFDVRKIEKLNNERRLEHLVPEIMWAALGNPTPSVIVEIGAGTGLFSDYFADMAPESIVYAADIEPVMIEWMEQNRQKVVGGRLRPLLVEETKVPLPDGVADLVVTIALHHELEDPASTYSDAFRLLAPNGQILVVDWALVDTPQGPPYHIRASAEELCQALARAGFDEPVIHPGFDWYSLVTASKGVR